METMQLFKHVLLVAENMTENLIGMEVTIGIRSEEGSKSATIVGYDEKNIKLKNGSGKVENHPYDPKNIILKVYQFDKGIKFCSQNELDEIENRKTEKVEQPVNETEQAPTIDVKQPNPKQQPRKKKVSCAQLIEF